MNDRELFDQVAKEARSYPYLTKDQEYKIAVQSFYHGCDTSRNKLINAHYRKVVKLVLKNKNYGSSLMELYQAGCMGLIRAGYKYDPDNEKGAAFATYANWWIQAAIQEFVMNDTTVQRVTSQPHKTVFFKWGEAARSLGIADDEMTEENIAAMADYLDVRAEDVVRVATCGSTSSLDMTMGDHEGSATHLDVLESHYAGPDDIVSAEEDLSTKRELLNEALKTLTERERDILIKREVNDEGHTLEDLSHEYEISRERIRQIQARAMEKIQRYLKMKKFTRNAEQMERAASMQAAL